MAGEPTRDRMLRDVASVLMEMGTVLLGGSPSLAEFKSAASVTTSACMFVTEIVDAFEMMDEQRLHESIATLLGPTRQLSPLDPVGADPANVDDGVPGPTTPHGWQAALATHGAAVPRALSPDQFLRPRNAPLRTDEPNPNRPVYEEPGSGTIWRGDPDEAECWINDYGQHDRHKHCMFVWLHRVRNGIEKCVDLRDLGITRNSQIELQGASLYPMPEDLARACQRLGFKRLALAVSKADIDENEQVDLFRAWEQNEAAVLAEATRRRALNDATRSNWDPVKMGGPHGADTLDETVAMLTTGAFDGPTVPSGRELKPLKPWQPTLVTS